MHSVPNDALCFLSPAALVQAQLVLRIIGLRSSPYRRVRASFEITTVPAFARRPCPSSFDSWVQAPRVLQALPPVPGAESDGEENYEFGAQVGSEADREAAVTRTQKAVTVAEVEAAALTSTHHSWCYNSEDVISMEDFGKDFAVCLTAQTVSFSIGLTAPITISSAARGVSNKGHHKEKRHPRESLRCTHPSAALPAARFNRD